MSLVKDMLKDNKQILLLTLGLLVLSVVGVFLMGQGMVGMNSTDMTRPLYSAPDNVIEEGIDYKVLLRTTYGDIKIDLFENDSPNAVNSFLFLSSKNFYDGLTFHKVIENFVIQAGDHVGDGTGDPGYNLRVDSNDRPIEEYSVFMANASQFFIITSGANLSEFSQYTPMGKVIEGYTVVDAIERAQVDNYKPINDIIISSVLIIEE